MINIREKFLVQSKAEDISKNLKNYALKNEVSNAKEYISNHKDELNQIKDFFGAEENPYIYAPYALADKMHNHTFTLEYQKEMQSLLGDNILFPSE